jgi:hypothetical protein
MPSGHGDQLRPKVMGDQTAPSPPEAERFDEKLD